jgi:tRNA threonylcarbamoyl adenosine modification protein YjeE
MSLKKVKIKYISYSPRETRDLAGSLAQKILKRPKPLLKQSLIIGLNGQLGTGKTVFIQGFAEAMGIKKRITSPTFVIMKQFKIDKCRFKMLFHLDCYRITAKDINHLGLFDLLANPSNIVLIEWANNIKKILPKQILKIKLDYGHKKNERKINICGIDLYDIV